jgi:hypothetical protein
MNYLLQILRIVVWTTCGFTSMAAFADARDDAMDARSVAMGQMTEEEARERMAARKMAEQAVQIAKAKREELIKKAWSCDPVLNQEVADKTRLTGVFPLGPEISEGLTFQIPRELLEFRSCPDLTKEQEQEMRNAFIREYVVFAYKEKKYSLGGNTYFATNHASYEKLSTELNSEEQSSVSGIAVSNLYAQAKREFAKKTEQAKIEAEKAAQVEARVLRMAGLYKGEIKVASFDDALLLYFPETVDAAQTNNKLEWVMTSPLLRPNNQVYGGVVVIDQEEGKLIRAKIGGYTSYYGGRVDVAYAMLRFTKKTVNYSERDMRVGGKVKVIGRYVQNFKYKTIGGEGKTAPLIEVMYIAD